MSKIEKQMIAVMVVGCLMVAVGVTSCSYAIKSAGGMKQIIIDTGKEIKEISEEIDKG